MKSEELYFLNAGLFLVRKTKEDAGETRRAILDAAIKVFVEKGVAKASLEEIAEGAGVTRGAVYWHFKNKLDVFQALHDQLYTPFSELILQGLEKNDSCPLKQLKELCTKLLIDIEREPQKKQLLTIFFLKCDYSGEMEAVLNCQNERKTCNLQMFSQYFERAKNKGHISEDADSQMLTLSLLCYITGIAYEYLRNPTIINLEKQAAFLMDSFFTGIINKKDQCTAE